MLALEFYFDSYVVVGYTIQSLKLVCTSVFANYFTASSVSYVYTAVCSSFSPTEVFMDYLSVAAMFYIWSQPPHNSAVTCLG